MLPSITGARYRACAHPAPRLVGRGSPRAGDGQRPVRDADLSYRERHILGPELWVFDDLPGSCSSPGPRHDARWRRQPLGDLLDLDCGSLDLHA